MANTFRPDPFMLDEDIAGATEDVAVKPAPITQKRSQTSAPKSRPAEPRSASIGPAKKRGRPLSANPKRQITLRLDADVVEHFRSGGKGWQTRINATLRRAAGL